MEPRHESLEKYGYYEPTHYPSLYDQPRYGNKRRAGFTTNKRRGESKGRRKMAAQSRKINRRK